MMCIPPETKRYQGEQLKKIDALDSGGRNRQGRKTSICD